MADSTPVLMVVAVLYKFVLAVLGLFIAVFWHKQLGAYFQGYYWLFYLGIVLNAILVAVLVWVMVTPVCAEKTALFLEGLLVKIRLLQPKEERKERLREAVARYGAVVRFFQENPRKIVVATVMTLVQRCSLFFLTWFIYSCHGAGRRQSVLDYGVAGDGIYCGGYAAIPRFGRYFRIGLRSGVCVRFPGERFGGVHVHFQRHQFLYGAAGKFGRLVCLPFSQSKSINQ